MTTMPPFEQPDPRPPHTTVEVRFKGSPRRYTYRMLRYHLPIVGRQVVVETPSNGMTIVIIETVHERPIEPPPDVPRWKWVVCPVDREQYNEVKDL